MTIAHRAEPSGTSVPSLLSARIAVTDDGTGVGPALVDLLLADGADASLVSRSDDTSDFGGLIFLDGLSTFATVDEAIDVNRRAFEAARALGQSDGGPKLLVTVSGLDGRFGLDGAADIDAANNVTVWTSGLTGLTRTAALEWPDCHVRAVDIDRAGRDAWSVADIIATELSTGGTDPEVGFPNDGSRIALGSTAAAVAAGGVSPLGASDVVVVSGGARGVTAATMIELAKASKATFVLLGRSVLVDEPPSCVGAATDAEIKKALLADAMNAGEKIDPKELSTRSQRVLAGREVRSTLETIESVGGRARYLAVDITNRSAVAEALESVRSDLGPITGVVHGAGVLADKLIAEQTDEGFARVFDTKVAGLRVLLDVTTNDDLKVLCLFSSVAARSGNRGQANYAIANEVLNKVASAERVRRGPGCVVKALGWGPWDGGMVSPSLKAHFEEMGVSLIGLSEGAHALVAELSSPQVDQVELVLGGGVLAAPR